MLNLFDYLKEEDNNIIYNYIAKNGLYDMTDYIGNENFLYNWSKSKKKMFHLLGGNLIYEVPYKSEKTFDVLISEMRKFKTEPNTCDLYNIFLDIQKENGVSYNLVLISKVGLFSEEALAKNECVETLIYEANENFPKKLVIQKGTKALRGIRKVLEYFGASQEDLDKFETFRIRHSEILNDKYLDGTLCFSIHPMDFMTMSDNASGWSSCMSWATRGCYSCGTIEMMNSNCVICVYLKSKKDFIFAPEFKENNTWNNKKWRQLFYINKEIIVGGKGYPYTSTDLTFTALNILKKLSEDNLNRTYEYGIEQYKDMTHMTYPKFEKIRNWIYNKKTKKHNIIFDTKGMYNDMYNDRKTPYYCFRNKAKKNLIICYSGKTNCLCCGDPIIEDNEWDESDDEYNSRYYNVGSLVCPNCKDKYICEECGEVISNEPLKIFKIRYGKDHVEKRRMCKDCVDIYLAKCPDCNSIVYKYNMGKYNFLNLYFSKKEDHYENYCTCPSCVDEEIKKFKKVKSNKIFGDYYVLNNEMSKEEIAADPHNYNNLKKIDF